MDPKAPEFKINVNNSITYNMQSQQQVIPYYNEINSLKHTNNNLNRHVYDLNRQIRELQSQLTALTNKNFILNDEIIKLKFANSKLNKSNKRKDKDIYELNAYIHILRQENYKLQKNFTNSSSNTKCDESTDIIIIPYRPY